MLLADDFRAMAQDALRGKWLSAALISLLAGLLGANIFGDFSLNLERRYKMQIETFFHSDLWFHYRIFFMIGGAVAVLYLLVMLVISGAATLGYARYNLNLVDHQEARVDDLFSQFHRLGQGFCMQFFRGLFIFLWSLLFVIPGIIAIYRYAMTPYILLEHPDMTAREAITASKDLMKGNKLRLFCLNLSFIGWAFLCLAPLLLLGGIAAGPLFMFTHSNVEVTILLLVGTVISSFCMLFVGAYAEASIAAFYREICREKNPPQDSFQPESTPFETYQMPYQQMD